MFISVIMIKSFNQLQFLTWSPSFSSSSLHNSSQTGKRSNLSSSRRLSSQRIIPLHQEPQHLGAIGDSLGEPPSYCTQAWLPVLSQHVFFLLKKRGRIYWKKEEGSKSKRRWSKRAGDGPQRLPRLCGACWDRGPWARATPPYAPHSCCDSNQSVVSDTRVPKPCEFQAIPGLARTDTVPAPIPCFLFFRMTQNGSI